MNLKLKNCKKKKIKNQTKLYSFTTINHWNSRISESTVSSYQIYFKGP